MSPMPPPVATIGPVAARRAALAAQGFADPPPAGAVSRRHVARVLGRVQLLQLDSVNVAVRAHYAPVFSRLGPYEQALLDEAAWAQSPRRPRLLVEAWAHEASLVPVADWPLVMAAGRRRWWKNYGVLVDQHPLLVEDVLAAVKELGPVSAGELEEALGQPGRRAGTSWWERSTVKRVCEFLFGTGVLVTGNRRHFQRLYDLPERVLPPAVLATHPVDPEAAARGLVLRAATALGVATEPDLRDYYRLGPQRSRAALAELVEAGELEPVRVRGWRHPAYRRPDARTPRQVRGRALLCPFDPLIWERERNERLVEQEREDVVAVLALGLGDVDLDAVPEAEEALVARVDLKADRAAGLLRVPGAFAEPGVDHARVAGELAGELHAMASWLGLERVRVGERGELREALARAVAESGRGRRGVQRAGAPELAVEREEVVDVK